MIPRIVLPKKAIFVPSFNREVIFSPFTIGTEKAILTLDEKHTTVYEQISMILDIVKSCCQEPDIKFDNLGLNELTYIFIHLRKISISSVISIKIPCECGKQHQLDINIDDIKFDAEKLKSKVFEVDTDNGKYKIEIGYPGYKDYSDIKYDSETADFQYVSRHITKYYSVDGNDIIDLTSEDKESLLSQLPPAYAKKIADFASNAPVPYYEAEIQCDCGKVVKETIKDFFG